ncbi:MAG: acylphosphatase [Xanthobacteraceae bacterium]
MNGKREEIARCVVVRGRVQGVGYRVWTEVTALERGLQGWVRNRRDGAVEALFAGPTEAVLAMIEACRRGPPGARVDFVDHREAGADELKLRRGDELFSVLGSV